MADCKCLATCVFFNDRMENMPATSNLYKKTYCQGDFEGCARYIVFKGLGRESVPPDLYPNQRECACGMVDTR